MSVTALVYRDAAEYEKLVVAVHPPKRSAVGGECAAKSRTRALPSYLQPTRLPTMNSATTLMTPHSSIIPRANTASNKGAAATNVEWVWSKAGFEGSAFSVWTETIVRVRGRIAVCVAVAFSVWTQITVPTGKKSKHPREECYWSHACSLQFKRACVGTKIPLVTRMQELQFKRAGVGSNGILECKSSV